MIKKEITINYSLEKIKDGLGKIAAHHSRDFKKLTFDDSFNQIKIWGATALGAGVSIDIYYTIIDSETVNLRIEYTGSGAKQQINEQNEASFERDFSELFGKYLKGEVDNEGKAKTSHTGCVLTLIILITIGVSAVILFVN